MLLNDRAIEMMAADLGLIEPYDRDRQQPASYDLTVAAIHDENGGEVWTVNPGETVLAVTAETVRLPGNVCGFIKDKSTYLRALCSVGQGFVDPGFCGELTVSFTNNSARAVAFRPGESFCQIVFARTSEPAENPYDGRYQYSAGVQGPAVLGLGAGR